MRLACALRAAAGLIWIPQAALLAGAVGSFAGGGAAVAWHAAAFLALAAVRAGLDAAASRRAFAAARTVLSARRAQATAALAARSPLDRARPAAGEAASVVAEQAEAVVPYLARYLPARVQALVVPAGLFLAALSVSWAAAAVLLVAVPMIPLFMALIGWRARAASAAELAELGSLNGFLLDRLRGLTTIRALDAVDLTARRLRAAADALRARTMAVLRIAFLSSAVLELFAALGIAMVAVYVGFHLLGTLPFGTWGGRLTLAQGLFVLLLAPAFFEPLRELAAVWHDRAAGLAALSALERLAAGGAELPGAAAAGTPAATDAAPDVAIAGLCFRHRDGPEVFADFHLTVAPGEHVAIAGPSGAGKSTLLDLIAGLALPQAGRIAIGGVALTAATAADLRARIAWIGQRPHFFCGSLAANVALGRPGIGAAEVARAGAVAALEPAAVQAVGEGGAGLSGGEALRLALARAAADPRAQLVLADEPTAHLDAETAAAVTQRLLAFAAGRTLVVATHDPALLARMHRVVRLEAAP